MHQSGGIVPLWLLFVDRFVQWPSPCDDCSLHVLCIPDINGIEGCINLEELYLNNTGITGTVVFNHQASPVTTAAFCCAFQTSVELKDASI
jgi:hypothetical protein